LRALPRHQPDGGGPWRITLAPAAQCHARSNTRWPPQCAHHRHPHPAHRPVAPRMRSPPRSCLAGMEPVGRSLAPKLERGPAPRRHRRHPQRQDPGQPRRCRSGDRRLTRASPSPNGGRKAAAASPTPSSSPCRSMACSMRSPRPASPPNSTATLSASNPPAPISSCAKRFGARQR
jgi:hypothetical protein